MDRKQCGRRVKSASLSPTNRHTRHTRDKALVLRLQREIMAGLDARCPDTGRGVVSAPFSSVIIRLDGGEHVTGRLVELELLDEDPMNKRGGTR